MGGIGTDGQFQRLRLPKCFGVVFSVCAAVLLFPAALAAQWNAAAYLGKVHTRDTTVHVMQPDLTDVFFGDVAFEDRSFETPLYYGLRAGYMFTPAVGVEGEFIHMKAYGRVDEPVPANGVLNGTVVNEALAPAVVLPRYDISHGLNFLLFNVVFKERIGSRFTVALRAGIGPSIPHAEIATAGASVEERDGYEFGANVVQLSGGAEVDITSRLYWIGEYKFTDTRQRFELSATQVESSFSIHHFVTGLGFRF